LAPAILRRWSGRRSIRGLCGHETRRKRERDCDDECVGFHWLLVCCAGLLGRAIDCAGMDAVEGTVGAEKGCRILDERRWPARCERDTTGRSGKADERKW